MPATTDPRIGSEIAGYRIDALLGRGGMGAVYRAWDSRLGRDIALKLLPGERAGDEGFRERFLRESRLAAAIEHPSIVPIHDAGGEDGVLYIAMRLVDGVDLRALLRREGKLEPARAVALAAQIASALYAAHARGLVHRDVKPANVLVSGSHAYLCDFGVSREATDAGPEGASGVLGTAGHAAPEQIEAGEAGAGADQYALACLLFECLTGARPFARETEVAALWAHLKEQPPAATTLVPALPRGLDSVLARGLAKNPAERYPSCSALVAAAEAELPLAGDERSEVGPATLAACCRDAADALLAGRLVLMLGPELNATGRAEGETWRTGGPHVLPDDAEVAAHLADRFGAPAQVRDDLVRVAQYVEAMEGSGPLYDELHEVFDADYATGPVHLMLARLPASLRARGAPNPLFVTTGYDDALERALAAAGDEPELVSYVAVGRDRGRFVHTGPSGAARVIDVPNAYAELSLDLRPIVLRIHGRVDRTPGRSQESFVASEDDFIDYLSRTDIANVVPVTLAATLRRSHVLFLGYRPAEWRLRVILNRLWGDGRPRYRSWAVGPVSPFERGLWRQRDVEVLNVALEEVVDELGRQVAR